MCSEAGLNLVDVGQLFYALPSPNGAKNRSFCREYTLPRGEKENCAKGWIESNARFGPVSDTKVCKTHGRYSVEVQVPSSFEDQTTSWIRIVNGVEKYVREAMPIEEEERVSVKPAAKARPTLKPSSTSNWNFVPVEQRKWIDIEVKRSQDLYCFQMSKFILNYFDTRKFVVKKMSEFLKIELLSNVRKFYQEDSRYWSDEVKEN